MIQFNLLPDVKLNYIKAKRSKHTVSIISIIVAASALSVLIFLFLIVNVVQKKHLNDLNNDIKKYSDQIKAVPDLDKVLTIQNQLNSLPGLNDQKHVASRLAQYVAQVTPAQVTISDLTVDMEAHTIKIQGGADQLSIVNKYADTLKFTKYTVDDKDDTNAFSSVVLSSFTRSDKDNTNKTTYEITSSFDPTIFDGTKNVALKVPNLITTRSETEKPTELFQAQPKQEGGQ